MTGWYFDIVLGFLIRTVVRFVKIRSSETWSVEKGTISSATCPTAVYGGLHKGLNQCVAKSTQVVVKKISPHHATFGSVSHRYLYVNFGRLFTFAQFR